MLLVKNMKKANIFYLSFLCLQKQLKKFLKLFKTKWKKKAKQK